MSMRANLSKAHYAARDGLGSLFLLLAYKSRLRRVRRKLFSHTKSGVNVGLSLAIPNHAIAGIVPFFWMMVAVPFPRSRTTPISSTSDMSDHGHGSCVLVNLFV